MIKTFLLIIQIIFISSFLSACLNPFTLFKKENPVQVQVIDETLKNSSQTNKKAPSSSFSHPKTLAAKSILDQVMMPDGMSANTSELDKIAHSVGGIRKSMKQAITQGIFIYYAGIENNIELSASEDSIILVFYGSENKITITPSDPSLKILIVHVSGDSNIYQGAQVMKLTEFKKFSH